MWGHKEKAIWPETNPLAPWTWPSTLQNCEEMNLCCLSHPVCCLLLGQLRLTNYSGFWFSDWVPGLLILVLPRLSLQCIFLSESSRLYTSCSFSLFCLFYYRKLREYLKVVGDLCYCKELKRIFYFVLIEPERTYAMKGMLSFGYLCPYAACYVSRVFPTVGHASKSSISSHRCHRRHIDNKAGSQNIVVQTKESGSG